MIDTLNVTIEHAIEGITKLAVGAHERAPETLNDLIRDIANEYLWSTEQSGEPCSLADFLCWLATVAACEHDMFSENLSTKVKASGMLKLMGVELP